MTTEIIKEISSLIISVVTLGVLPTTLSDWIQVMSDNLSTEGLLCLSRETVAVLVRVEKEKLWILLVTMNITISYDKQAYTVKALKMPTTGFHSTFGKSDGGGWLSI